MRALENKAMKRKISRAVNSVRGHYPRYITKAYILKLITENYNVYVTHFYMNKPITWDGVFILRSVL